MYLCAIVPSFINAYVCKHCADTYLVERIRLNNRTNVTIDPKITEIGIATTQKVLHYFKISFSLQVMAYVYNALAIPRLAVCSLRSNIVGCKYAINRDAFIA